MKFIRKEIWEICIIGFLVPAVLLCFMIVGSQKGQEETVMEPSDPRPSTSNSTAASEDSQPTAPPEMQQPIRISVLTDEGVKEMELERYVLGVVLAEMPTSFESEALKAQAVAARTVALHFCETGRHNGSVCTSYACCQAYISEENYLSKGGMEERLQKAADAVQGTAGQILLYDGKLVCATYFSCSGGRTEAAVAVWGSDIPYLQAVDSPGEEFATVYRDQFYFTPEELQDKLCITISGQPETWFGQVQYTEGGGVATMEIGGVAYRGTTLRTLLGLRSTYFSVRMEGDLICFETRGYGHRVGMSQYGAQAMALSGADYESILTHYYQGAILSGIPN